MPSPPRRAAGPCLTLRDVRVAGWVGSLQYPYHITRTSCSLACAPHTHPLVFVTAVSHMRAGPVVSATSWSSKLRLASSPPRAATGTGSV